MTGYTLDEIEAIAGWLRDGLTAQQIATGFTARYRFVTRNAIIGIVLRNKVLHKIGFARSPASARKDTAHTPSAPRVVKATAPVAHKITHNPPVKKEIPAPKPVRHIPSRVVCREITLLELKKGDCRWPCNTPERGEVFLFCGLPADPDRSYCARHHMRSVSRGTPSERAAGPVLARAAA